MAYSKTPRARRPTEKAAAYAKKKANDNSDGGKNFDRANICLYVGALNKSLLELRGKKRNCAPFDATTIQLKEAVYGDKVVSKLYGCPDRTFGLLIMLRCQSSIEYMSSDDSDGDVVDYSAEKKRLKTNDYDDYSNGLY